MSLSHSFTGKRVLVTGGGQGIGRQLVQRFHDGGSVVFTVDKNPELISKLKEELPGVTAVVLDLTDWGATTELVASFGALDHLVNTAGICISEGFMDITEDASNLLYKIHVQAMINVSQTVAKGMIAQGTGGTIVNFSSMAYKKAYPGIASYSAAKAAVKSLTQCMALELGPHNIRVNCVIPGAVDTTMFIPEMIVDVINNLVIKRLIKPDEIADTVLFLLSPLSSMIVGQGIIIDGGWDII